MVVNTERGARGTPQKKNKRKVALRYCLTCLGVPSPYRVDSNGPVIGLPASWRRSYMQQAHALPFLSERYRRPFDYYATFFSPSLEPGAIVGPHSVEDMRSFLLKPAHLSLPHWIQSFLKLMWPLSADFHSLHAWVAMDYHTLEGLNHPFSIRRFAGRVRARFAVAIAELSWQLYAAAPSVSALFFLARGLTLVASAYPPHAKSPLTAYLEGCQ